MTAEPAETASARERRPLSAGLLLQLMRELARTLRLRNRGSALDEVDCALLHLLAADARRSIAELACDLGQSPPRVVERMRQLEEAGVIRGYGVRLDAGALGLPLAAFLRISPRPGRADEVAAMLSGLESVVECHRLSREERFVARLQLRRLEELDAVVERLAPFASTESDLIRSSLVERHLPALPYPPSPCPPSPCPPA